MHARQSKTFYVIRSLGPSRGLFARALPRLVAVRPHALAAVDVLVADAAVGIEEALAVARAFAAAAGLGAL